MLEHYVIVGPDGSGLEEIKDVVRAFQKIMLGLLPLDGFLKLIKRYPTSKVQVGIVLKLT